jgi:rhodanese-related sulfurtransferase
MKWGELDIKNINVIDVRDYNDSYKEPISGAVNIPIAYLNRYYSEIPNVDLYIVASDKIEKNMGVRILRKKGFQIIGCAIKNNENTLSFKTKTFSNC